MAKKKAAKELFVCLHCSKEFQIPIHWCPSCEDHMGTDGWIEDNDTCDRCASGKNKQYLKHKKGRDERLAAALEAMKDPKNWCDCGAVEAFEKWVASDEYKWRFETLPPALMGMKVVSSDVMPEGSAMLVSETGGPYDRKIHVAGVIGVGCEVRAVSFDLEENGAWPPDEVLTGVF